MKTRNTIVKKSSLIVTAILFIAILVAIFTLTVSAANWPVIKNGSRGAEVYATQTLLNYRGFSCGTPDEIAGTKTDSAIRSFQKSQGLAVDGCAGENTLSRLVVTVKNGDKNEAVRAMQYLLKNKFKMNIAVDAVFGGDTLSAVKAFQSAMGLTSDGIAGINTWRELFGASARTIPIQTTTPAASAGNRAELAKKILNRNDIVLNKSHPSGIKDGADPYSNIVDTANGKAALRSSYKDKDGQAPGGSTYLSPELLKALIFIADNYSGTITVTSIAGAAHTSGSNHYAGRAIDLQIGGITINQTNANAIKNLLNNNGFKVTGENFLSNNCFHIAVQP